MRAAKLVAFLLFGLMLTADLDPNRGVDLGGPEAEGLFVHKAWKRARRWMRKTGRNLGKAMRKAGNRVKSVAKGAWNRVKAGVRKLKRRVGKAVPKPLPKLSEKAAVDELVKLFGKSMEAKKSGSTWHRGFHAKAHGCVFGTLTPDPKRPKAARVGTFATDKPYKVWARFSNGSSQVNRDMVPDARGVALKILDAPGRKLLPGHESDKNQDMLFCASKVLFVSNVAEYNDAVRAIAQGGSKALSYLLKNPRYAVRVGKFLMGTPLAKNPLYLSYYSASPFAMGSQKVKYALMPCKKKSFNVGLNINKDSLRQEMKKTLAKQDACFNLMVQFYKNEKTTPIEDFAIEWKTKHSPFVRIATVTFPKQSFDTPQRNEFCEHLSMNPWRVAEAHKPIGALNRVRRMVYERVAALRHAKNKVPMSEPSGDMLAAAANALEKVPVPKTVPLQGLTVAEQQELFHLPQGAEIIPIDLLRALDDPKTERPFMENWGRFGLLDDPDHELPVGMTMAKPLDIKLLGFKQAVSINCASCHVGEIRYKGKALRILGGQGLFDSVGFAIDIAAAVRALVKSPARMVRFLKRLFSGDKGGDAAKKKSKSKSFFGKLKSAVKKGWNALKKGVKSIASKLADLAKRFAKNPKKFFASLKNTFKEGMKTFRLLKARVAALRQAGSDPITDAGPGRIDSFGGGLKKFFPVQAPPTSSPISYAPLWDIERTQWYHWDGNTNSAIERNIGNAIGLGVVYDKTTFESTLRIRNLYRLEELFRKLKPPKWPTEMLGAIDNALAAKGKQIYTAQCAGCHEARAGEMISAKTIGTDPNRASVNLLKVKGPDGKMTNALMLAVEAGRRILAKSFKDRKIAPEERKKFASGRPDPGEWRLTGKYRIPFISAVWATPPYLHNGSVPTLYDLLLPPEKRPKTFLVGSFEFDPKKVGYVTHKGDPVAWTFDTTKTGNHNTGHTAGTNLSENDRMALIEYLKIK